MSKLRAILFDIDDTLFSTTGFARKARRNAVRAMVDHVHETYGLSPWRILAPAPWVTVEGPRVMASDVTGDVRVVVDGAAATLSGRP